MKHKKTILLTCVLGLSACFGVACLTGIKQSKPKESTALTIEDNEPLQFNIADFYNSIEYWYDLIGAYYNTYNSKVTPITTASLSSQAIYKIGATSYNVNYTYISFYHNYSNYVYHRRIYLYQTASPSSAGTPFIDISYDDASGYRYTTLFFTTINNVGSTALFKVSTYNNDSTLSTDIEAIAWYLEDLYTPDTPDNPDTPVTSDSVTFTFDNQINYYAPYQQNINTLFVHDNNMTSSTTYQFKTLLEGLTFVSGGQTFDTIRLRYTNAQSQKYINDTGNLSTWSTELFASYEIIEYVNSNTNISVIVNQRNTPTYSDNSSTAIIQTKGSTWVSQSYRYIVITEPINEVTITTLGTLNNASVIKPSVFLDNDVGLENVFTLLSSAFASWLPIMSIQLIPGITLGLLIFMPLIVGIIILIIWLVKR